jgi:hypothetical protein
MPQTANYLIINGQMQQINMMLATKQAEGWRPILMSSSTHGSGAVEIFIMLEKPLGEPQAGQRS